MKNVRYARGGIRAFAVMGLAVALPALLPGCQDDELATASPLSNAYASPEALAEAALAALEAQSDSTLASLMIEREEYQTLLWPEMPDREYTPFEFIWSQTLPPSRKARRNVMSDFEGIGLELVAVDTGAEDTVERYPSFTLYRDARMTVRRTDNGAEGVLPLMDALVEMGGGWKFMNYRDNT